MTRYRKYQKGSFIQEREDFDGNPLSGFAYWYGSNKNFGKLNDLYRYYVGKPLQENVLTFSEYQPSKSSGKGDQKYIAINDPDFEKEVLKHANRVFVDKNLRTKKNVKGKLKALKNDAVDLKVNDSTYRVAGYGKSFTSPQAMDALGNFFVSKGEDEKGEYISYYDVFDVGKHRDPYGNQTDSFGAGKPFEIYNRIYVEKDEKGRFKRAPRTTSATASYQKGSFIENPLSLDQTSLSFTATSESLPESSYSKIQKKLYKNMTPFSYEFPPVRFAQAVIFDKKAKDRDQFFPVRGPFAHLKGKEYLRNDAWAKFLNQRQEKDTIVKSAYRPTRSKNKDAQYYDIRDDGWRDQMVDKALDIAVGNYRNYGATDDLVLGDFQFSYGEDKKGKYIAYYDEWDLDYGGNVFGKPFEIYGRIYEDELKEHFKSRFKEKEGKKQEKAFKDLGKKVEEFNKLLDEERNTPALIKAATGELKVGTNKYGGMIKKHQKGEYVQIPHRHNMKPYKPYYYRFQDYLSQYEKQALYKAAERTGLDPVTIWTNVMSEGGDKYLYERDQVGGEVPSDGFISGVAYFGTDTLGTKIDLYKKEGLIPKSRKYDTSTWTNELEQEVTPAHPENFAAALDLHAAHLKKLNDRINKKYKDLTPLQKEFFTYVSFNAGPGAADKMIASYKRDGLLKDDSFLTADSQKNWNQPFQYSRKRVLEAQHMRSQMAEKSDPAAEPEITIEPETIQEPRETVQPLPSLPSLEMQPLGRYGGMIGKYQQGGGVDFDPDDPLAFLGGDWMSMLGNDYDFNIDTTVDASDQYDDLFKYYKRQDNKLFGRRKRAKKKARKEIERIENDPLYQQSVFRERRTEKIGEYLKSDYFKTGMQGLMGQWQEHQNQIDSEKRPIEIDAYTVNPNQGFNLAFEDGGILGAVSTFGQGIIDTFSGMYDAFGDATGIGYSPDYRIKYGAEGSFKELHKGTRTFLRKMENELGDYGISPGDLVITSMNRTPQQNRRVGGVRNSKHLQGKAFDLRKNKRFGRWAKSKEGRQWIRENGYKMIDEGDHYHFEAYQDGGQIKTSKTGFLKGSPDENEEALRILGNRITMNGVENPLYLVPNLGEPVYAEPNSGEYIFPGATEVMEINLENMAKGGKIKIKPENKGKFTASANRAGMGVQEYARHVLANKDEYSSTLVKRANFARNAAKWKKQEGGMMDDFVPVQLEKGEEIIFEDGSIVKPKANKRHSQMGDYEMTDYLPEGTYIASRDKSQMLDKDVADNLFVMKGGDPVYNENEPTPIRRDKTLGDMFRKKKELPADIARRIRSRIPTTTNEDIFGEVTNAYNLQTRKPHIDQLIRYAESVRTEEDNPQMAKYGGWTYKKGGPTSRNYGRVRQYGGGGSIVGEVLGAVPGVGDLVNSVGQIITAGMQYSLAKRAEKRIEKNQKKSIDDINSWERGALGRADTGLGLSVGSVLGQFASQDPSYTYLDLQAPRSRTQNTFTNILQGRRTQDRLADQTELAPLSLAARYMSQQDPRLGQDAYARGYGEFLRNRNQRRFAMMDQENQLALQGLSMANQFDSLEAADTQRGAMHTRAASNLLSKGLFEGLGTSGLNYLQNQDRITSTAMASRMGARGQTTNALNNLQPAYSDALSRAFTGASDLYRNVHSTATTPYPTQPMFTSRYASDDYQFGSNMQSSGILQGADGKTYNWLTGKYE